MHRQQPLWHLLQEQDRPRLVDHHSHLKQEQDRPRLHVHLVLQVQAVSQGQQQSLLHNPQLLQRLLLDSVWESSTSSRRLGRRPSYKCQMERSWKCLLVQTQPIQGLLGGRT